MKVGKKHIYISVVFLVIAWITWLTNPVLMVNNSGAGYHRFTKRAISLGLAISEENGDVIANSLKNGGDIRLSDGLIINAVLSEDDDIENRFRDIHVAYIVLMVLICIHLTWTVLFPFITINNKKVVGYAALVTGFVELALLCAWYVVLSDFMSELDDYVRRICQGNEYYFRISINWGMLLCVIFSIILALLYSCIYLKNVLRLETKTDTKIYAGSTKVYKEIICPVCKEKTEKNAMFCGRCGSSIKTADDMCGKKTGTKETATKSTTSETTGKEPGSEETKKAKSKVKYSTFGSEKKYYKTENSKRENETKKTNVNLEIIFSSEEFDRYLERNMYRCRMCDSENVLGSTVCMVCGSDD